MGSLVFQTEVYKESLLAIQDFATAVSLREVEGGKMPQSAGLPHQNAIDWMAETAGSSFLTTLEAASLRSGCQLLAGPLSGLWVDTSCRVEFLSLPLLRQPNPVKSELHSTTSLNLNSLLTALSPETVTLGVRILAYAFWGQDTMESAVT